MNRARVIGLLLIAIGVILNQLELDHDLVDFIMGVCVGLGLGLLLAGFFKPKSKHV